MVGNGHIAQFLTQKVVHNAASGVYIFYGQEGLGKKTAATYFAKTLLCEAKTETSPMACGSCSSCLKFQSAATHRVATVSHGDFYAVEREEDKKNISIDQVREFIKAISLSSFLNDYKIGIINHAETLSIEAANSLLKTLEESNDKVVVILITNDLQALPETIISRSQVLRFYPVSFDIIYHHLVDSRGVSRSEAKNLARLAAGRPAWAEKFLEQKDVYENYISTANVFLDFFNTNLNQRMAVIDSLAKQQPERQLNGANGADIVNIWQAAARDLVLLSFGRNDIIQHEVLIDKLLEIKQRIGLDKIFPIFKHLATARKYLATNVNPKTALEYIAINI